MRLVWPFDHWVGVLGEIARAWRTGWAQGWAPQCPALPPGQAAQRAVAQTDEAMRRTAIAAGSPVHTPRRSPLAQRRLDGQPHAAHAEAFPESYGASVRSADPELMMHTWGDGGCGHTGDLWHPGITPADVACGDYNEHVGDGGAFCHNPARHQATDVVATCEGFDDAGVLYRWTRQDVA